MNELSDLRDILLLLAHGYEQGVLGGWIALESENDEGRPRLRRILATLKSEGAIQEVPGGGAYKLTSTGYSRHLAQITAWRVAADQQNAPAESGNLSPGILLKIMNRLRDLRASFSPFTMSDSFFDLAPQEIRDRGDQPTSYYIDAHLEFLQGRGYVELGQPTMMIRVRPVKLTSEGQMFVQPELAEFGQRQLLPQVVNSLEQEMQVLTYPTEKESLLYKIRDAIARNSPDLIAKVLVEIGSKVATGGM
jgi:hypothetical protein